MVVEEAKQLLTWAEAGDALPPGLGEDLRALTLTSLGITGAVVLPAGRGGAAPGAGRRACPP